MKVKLCLENIGHLLEIPSTFLIPRKDPAEKAVTKIARPETCSNELHLGNKMRPLFF